MSVRDFIISDIETVKATRVSDIEGAEHEFTSAYTRLNNYFVKTFGEDSPKTNDLKALGDEGFNDPEVYDRLLSYIGE